MAGHSRYSVSDEQAGINQGVLKNNLGYTKQTDLDDAETILQTDTYKHFFDLSNAGELTFDFDLLRKIHKYFFEILYIWAGSIRTVDISKGEMLFAPVKYISTALKHLDQIIKDNLPKPGDNPQKTAGQLALIHNEFNAVHPFRDGNGRTIRIFLDLLAHTSGYNPINYGNRKDYLAACITGATQDNKSMQKIIRAGLSKH